MIRFVVFLTFFIALQVESFAQEQVHKDSALNHMELKYKIYYGGIPLAIYTLRAQAQHDGYLEYVSSGQSSTFIDIFSFGKYKAGIRQKVAARSDAQNPFRPMWTDYVRSKGFYRRDRPWGLDIDYFEDGSVHQWKTYVDNSVVSQKPDFIPLIPEHISLARDLSTATLLFLTHTVEEGGSFCHYSDHIFTGTSVVKFTMRHLRYETLKRPLEIGFQGETEVCTMDAEYLSGYREEWAKKKPYTREFFFGRYHESLPIVLLKAKIGSSIGLLHVVLTQVTHKAQ